MREPHVFSKQQAAAKAKIVVDSPPQAKRKDGKKRKTT